MDLDIFQTSSCSKELLTKIGQLRVIAWRHDGEMPLSLEGCGDVWLDEHDIHAHHWVIKKGVILAASARLCMHSTDEALPDVEYLQGGFFQKITFPAAFFNRLVVHPSARGTGLAGRLDRARIQFATNHGARVAIIHTCNPLRIHQLLAAGWEMLGESPHRFVSRAENYVFLKNLQS